MNNIIQIALSVILIVLIVLQSKGTGLGSAWGGGGENYHTKRGFEKILFATTIITATLFILSSLLNVLK